MGSGRWENEAERLAVPALVAAMAAAAVLLLWEGRSLTLFIDEWSFGYLSRHGLGLSELLEPDNGHLAAVPVLLTKASLELFGADTTLPLRLVSIAAHLAVTGMVFVFLRRALGPVVALPPTVLFLFLGAASDAFLGSHSIPVQLAAASGLGAMLALGARSRTGDALAAGLLVVGVLCNGFALPFLVGAAAIVLLDPAPRRSRLWVVAVPALVYAAWWIGWGRDAESGFDIDNVGGLPAFAFESLAAVLAALTGLFTEAGVHTESFALGPGLALAGVALAAALVLGVRGYRPPRAAVPALLALLALWAATGLVAGPLRHPNESRYVYTSAALLLIAAGPLIATVPYRRRASIALAAICAIALIPNLREIHYSGNFFRTQASLNRAVLGAIEETAPPIGSGQRVEPVGEAASGNVADMRGSVDDYREARESYGTPAYTPEQLLGADLGAREAADRALARLLELRLAPASGPPGALPPEFTFAPGAADVRRAGGCLLARPTGPDAVVTFELPPGGVRLRSAAGPTVPVSVRRIGEPFAVAAGTLIGGIPADLRLPAGPASAGWQAHLPILQRTAVCGV
jgi:hypothetical protein